MIGLAKRLGEIQNKGVDHLVLIKHVGDLTRQLNKLSLTTSFGSDAMQVDVQDIVPYQVSYEVACDYVFKEFTT